jgi:hypothetical protein
MKSAWASLHFFQGISKNRKDVKTNYSFMAFRILKWRNLPQTLFFSLFEVHSYRRFLSINADAPMAAKAATATTVA